MLTFQIVLTIGLGIVLMVPTVKIVHRMRRDEADETDKTVFVFLSMGLVFLAAFLRWYLMPWIILNS